LTANIKWDSIAELLKALGLDRIIDVDLAVSNLKAVVQQFEDTLMDPNALIKDIIGVDITAAVDSFVNT